VIKVGVIGYGYWGPNLVRNLVAAPGAQVVSVCDLRPDRLEKVGDIYPAIKVTMDSEDIFKSSSIDAVVICTPVSTHYELAMGAIKTGKHVLVEKPMAATSEQSQRLIEEALRRKLTLMVDHTFIYTGAVRKIKELIQSGEIGDVYYYDSVRVNLGMFQHDVNVVWDLAVHDLSIMDYVLDTQPKAVSAIGISNIPGSPENIAYLTLFLEGNKIAHIHVNWLTPVKIRRTLIGGSNKMIVFDDLEPSEKLKIYNKGITINSDAENRYKVLVGYRVGDLWVPHVPHQEALQVEVCHFIDCVEHGKKPITDGESGFRIVRILEAANKSIADSGELIEL